MIRSWIANWKTLLAVIAVLIVSGTIFYSQYLAQKIATDERKKVTQWVEAQKILADSSSQDGLTLASTISADNTDIPIIETNEKDLPTGIYRNLDSIKVQEPGYLQEKLKTFRSIHAPIIVVLKDTPYQANKYYYGSSLLQQQVRYYPMVQLAIVALFILFILLFFRTMYQSRQNQLWAGMAKETAHQLGTPVSSLQGWVEMLKENNDPLATEIEKDVKRLELVSDRFGKIGSTPKLEQKNIAEQIEAMAAYMRKRAGNSITIDVHASSPGIEANISAPLFDWVIENLLKNALDAMEGKGKITIDIEQTAANIIIDVTDNGKGIPKANVARIFNPGFTTRKRGWGLGLTLTKRIIEQYHKGSINVKWSEVGKGTTFRIILNK